MTPELETKPALLCGQHIGRQDLRRPCKKFVGLRHESSRNLTVDVRLACVFATERVEDPERRWRGACCVPGHRARLSLGERECTGQQGRYVLRLVVLGFDASYECVRRVHISSF